MLSFSAYFRHSRMKRIYIFWGGYIFVFKALASVTKKLFLTATRSYFLRAKGEGKLSVVIGTNKPFENSQLCFTVDGKYCNVR